MAISKMTITSVSSLLLFSLLFPAFYPEKLIPKQFQPRSSTPVDFECASDKYPFYVYVKASTAKTEHVCGGSLLTAYSVLTSATCCEGIQSGRVYTGLTSNTSNFDQTMEIVVPPARHEKQMADSYTYDYCVIMLEKPLILGEHTGLVKLASKEYIQDLLNVTAECSTKTLIIVGHTTSIDGEASFQCISRHIRLNHVCEKDLGDDYTRSLFDADSMFCHYEPRLFLGRCKTVPGSPIMYQDKQIGIENSITGLNWTTCPDQMSVGTRLDAALDWIIFKSNFGSGSIKQIFSTFLIRMVLLLLLIINTALVI